MLLFLAMPGKEKTGGNPRNFVVLFLFVSSTAVFFFLE